MKKVLGEDKFRFRIAATDKNTVVLTIGGAGSFFADAVKTAAANSGTIAADPETVTAMKHLPPNMSSVMLFSVGNLFDLIDAGQKKMAPTARHAGQDHLQTPIAVGAGKSGQSMHVVVFVPTGLIKETAQAVGGMFGWRPRAPARPARPSRPSAETTSKPAFHATIPAPRPGPGPRQSDSAQSRSAKAGRLLLCPCRFGPVTLVRLENRGILCSGGAKGWAGGAAGIRSPFTLFVGVFTARTSRKRRRRMSGDFARRNRRERLSGPLLEHLEPRLLLTPPGRRS